MNPLEQKIIEKIKREGPITFEEFMELALYDPQFGYYAGKKTRIGTGGDFFTSSHLHPVFGALLGNQIEEMWEFMGRPHDFRIVEMGAGEGHTCGDMLNFLKGGDFFGSMSYNIIELNPVMRDRQRGLLSEFSGKVKWFSSLYETGDVRGCILSNELLDAFPVHLVLMEDELKEIYITVKGRELIEEAGPLSTTIISEYLDEISAEFEKGYKTEVNLKIRDWLDAVNRILIEGFVLTIDYGYTERDYYSEDRNRGTLMCYHMHQFNENPLQNIGKQDMTAHVNFSSVKKWGEVSGFKTIGYCSQGAFLVSLGIDEEIKRLSVSSNDYLFELAKIKKLILPCGMGESHMVLAQYKGTGNPVLKGFSTGNRIKYL